MTANEHLGRLAEYIARGQCALFVGPDIGESAGGFRGLPTSWQLADELAARCGYRGRYRSLSDMAGIFEDRLGRPALVEFLRDRLAAPGYRPLPVHRLIAMTPFPVIVSGAWDTLLEQALDQQGAPYRVVRRHGDLPYLGATAEALAKPRTLLYKLYGSIAEPDTLVISEKDQDNLPYELEGVIERLKIAIEERASLLIGYALPAQDTVFVRLYHDICRRQKGSQPPAFAVQSLNRPEDAAAWEARDVTAIIADPATFLRDLALAVAAAQGRELTLPDLAELSDAPRMTAAELAAQAEVLDAAMDRIGVADLVEQTDVPLLSEEQLRDIETMRAAYERLARGFAPEQTPARVWLRQGNIEYVRQNFARAEEYYRQALAAEPDLAEAYHNLHYVLVAQHNLAGADQAYQRAVALQPDLAILPPRYRVEATLGSGGLGVVYRAWDTQTGGNVAVKVLHRQQALTERVLASFKREAQILRELSHPNIVRLLDFQPYRGSYFIVMEYLEGRTLKEVLKSVSSGEAHCGEAHYAEGAPFSLEEAYRIISQVCDGLEYAHAHNIVHRDLKPSNIFLVGDQVKLIDFGLARPLDGAQQSTLGIATGTAEYMAPEQAEGRPADRRTDVYALGTVFDEMLTGRNPSQGAFRPASELRPGLNDALDLVIEKARERAPEDRYPDVASFRKELAQVVAMQAPAKDAPWPLRAVARTAQALKVATERGWPWLLAAALVLGIPLPMLLPNAAGLREAGRVASVLLAVAQVLVPLVNLFALFVARRVRCAPIAAYSRAMGVLLGLANGLFWLRAFGFVDPAVTIGSADIWLYLEALFINYLLFSLGSAFLVELSTILGVATLARRLGQSFADAFFVAFMIWVGGLVAAAIMLPPGWFGLIG